MMSDEDRAEREPWRVSIAEFKGFLGHVQRSTSCPVCPHRGDWTIHVDAEAPNFGLDPNLLVYVIPGFSPDNLDKAKYRQGHFAMECPNCGTVQFVSCLSVARHLGLFPEQKTDG